MVLDPFNRRLPGATGLATLGAGLVNAVGAPQIAVHPIFVGAWVARKGRRDVVGAGLGVGFLPQVGFL